MGVLLRLEPGGFSLDGGDLRGSSGGQVGDAVPANEGEVVTEHVGEDHEWWPLGREHPVDDGQCRSCTACPGIHGPAAHQQAAAQVGASASAPRRVAGLRDVAVGDLQKTVGRNLRAYRLERGLSQEAFADVLGVHRTYMGGVERGERNLTLKSLEKMAEQIGVEVLPLLEE